MSGSTIGNLFQVTTWGESHGKALGAIIDGCPAGLPLSEADIMPYLYRRKPGQSRYTTSRQEEDQVEILSGVFEGRTTGTPLSMIVYNRDQHSKDYGNLVHTYRPGHADYSYDAKYGIRDYRGGGRSSGRETIARVAAGAVASKLLDQLGIHLTSFTTAIGPVSLSEEEYRFDEIKENPFYMPNNVKAEAAAAYVEQCMKRQDSCGGKITSIASGVPAGLGNPVFGKLDAVMAGAVMSIGAVKTVTIGDESAHLQNGSSFNDSFLKKDGSGNVIKKTNHSGGILGGISDGSDIVLHACIKPTPSISQEQQTLTDTGDPCTLSIVGRHDPVIVPRAVVVVESMVAITLADALLMNMSSRVEAIKDFYSGGKTDAKQAH